MQLTPAVHGCHGAALGLGSHGSPVVRVLHVSLLLSLSYFFFFFVSFPFFFFIFFLFFFFSFSLSCSHSLPAFHMAQLCSLCSSYPRGILFNATHKDSP